MLLLPLFEVTGGVLSTDGCGAYTGSESDGTNEENFCIDLGFSRCPKQGSSSQEMVAPSDGSDITAKVGFANGFGTVSITETCTLVAANDDTVVDLVIATDDLSILEDAVVLAELATTLSGDGPFTVFAPNNEAFQNLSEGDLTTLLNDIPALTDVLLYHVVSGTVLSTDLMDGMVVSTLLTDATFTVDLSNGVSFVFDTGSASPVSVDNLASNGVVHIIDTVLIPPVTPGPTAAPAPGGGGGGSKTSKSKRLGLQAGLGVGLGVLILCLLVAIFGPVFTKKDNSYDSADTEAPKATEEA
uniref:FAS1 domain-containing protein n=1 Tax=Aureoumbra lagunensis TaxID=44058 RepID=A0A7S3K4W3_9STRA